MRVQAPPGPPNEKRKQMPYKHVLENLQTGQFRVIYSDYESSHEAMLEEDLDPEKYIELHVRNMETNEVLWDAFKPNIEP